MISRLEALNVAIRHRQLLSQLIEFRQDPSILWRGSLTEAEHALLKRAVEQSAASKGPVVEIGTLFGFTTAMMASWLGAGQRLITVDNYSWNSWRLAPDVHRALTRRILAPFMQGGQVEIADMDSEKFFASYAGDPPALVFIDGDHSYAAVHREIEWARKCGAVLIGGHDYCEEIKGVVQAVDEHFPHAITQSGTVWMWGLK
jgi:predicted O-methyltransferase YrrM